MFDFTSTKESQPNVLALEATTFNFDSSDFTSMITEADDAITKRMSGFRSLMSEVLTESAGVLNEDAELVMENANETIGQRIVKLLTAIKNWLIKTAQTIILKVQTFMVTNKKVIDKIKPEVAKKLNNGELKGLKAEVHEYDLGVIKIENIVGKWNDQYKASAYDLTPDYTDSSREKLDESVKAVESTSREDIALRAVRSMYTGNAKSMKDVGVEARKLLRKGGERKAKEFSMDYAAVVENFQKVKEPIDKAFKGMVKEVDDMIKEIKSKVKESKTSTSSSIKTDPKNKDHVTAAKSFHSGQVAYFNAKRKILSVALDTAILLNNIKLQAAVEQAREAKQFVVKAYHYKAPKNINEAAEDLYEPYLDVDSDEVADTPYPFNESANDAW